MSERRIEMGTITYGEDMEEGFYVHGLDEDKCCYGITLEDAMKNYFDKYGV